MFKLEADELVKDIKALPYGLDDYCKFGDGLLELPFLFLEGHRMPRFTLVSTNETKKAKAPADTTTDAGLKKGLETVWLRYYGREAFRTIYGDVVPLRKEEGFQSTTSMGP